MNTSFTPNIDQELLSQAEKLIRELPNQHEGRNNWLSHYDEAKQPSHLDKKDNLTFDPSTVLDFEPAY